jgi:hypothetical protein
MPLEILATARVILRVTNVGPGYEDGKATTENGYYPTGLALHIFHLCWTHACINSPRRGLS